MDLFDRQWATYRSVVDNDWMEHSAITAACQGALELWMTEHPERNGTARLLDLGCGDLAQMGPVFRTLPLGGYVGVDITEQVLGLARAALGPAPFAIEFQHSDVETFVAAEGSSFDLVHASLVLHHLPDEEKARFLSVLRRRLRLGGAFLWADVFCEPAESRSDYLARYTERIRRDWCAIDADAREAIVTHVSTFDFPADRAAIVVAAREAGWNWQWLWQGRHRAEAVALLTPAPAQSAPAQLTP